MNKLLGVDYSVTFSRTNYDVKKGLARDLTNTMTRLFALKRYAASLLTKKLSLSKFLKPNVLNIYPDLYVKINN